MKAIEEKVAGMPDSDQKRVAVAELAAAKISIRADKLRDCSAHLENAITAAGTSM